jgi:hypothetical protein
MQAILTVVADRETELAIAFQLGQQLVAQGMIAEVRPAVSPRGFSFILKDGTSQADRQAIIAQIHSLGFITIEAG